MSYEDSWLFCHTDWMPCSRNWQHLQMYPLLGVNSYWLSGWYRHQGQVHLKVRKQLEIC